MSRLLLPAPLLAEETGVQAGVLKPLKRPDDIENGLNLMKLKKSA
ncbi:hypothetical protein [Akkermansia sp.]|nr:hypothetical protein [Akkermansia sp.]